MRLEVMGSDRGRGNLLGIEPCLSAGDYRSADQLESALAACLEEARGARLLGERTVAVFPEYIGAWLVAAGEPERVYRALSTAAAMRAVALRRPVAFLASLLASRASDRATESLFRLKAGRVAGDYQRVFSRLAARWRLTVVGGSVILPRPHIVDGVLVPGSGPLVNASAVFSPDGSIVANLVTKCHPTAEEQQFIAGGLAPDLPSFRTPAGALGVLVCADSWFPDCWARMRELGVEMVAVVSFSHGDDTWSRPWAGYSGAPKPADVDAADIGSLSEAAAWRTYALAGRVGSSRARCAVNVFLRGSLWGMGSDGRTTMVRDSEVCVLEPEAGPAAAAGTIACCWL